MVSHDTPKPARRAGAASLPWLHSPLEITPHKAGVVREAEIVAAAEALVAMAAERGGTGALEELGAGGAEDVGHLQAGPVHFWAGSVMGGTARSSASSGFTAVRRWRVDKCR